MRGALGERYVVTCNGRALPLHPTGTHGRVRRRRPLPRLAAGRVPAPDDPRARAARLRRWSTPGTERSLGGCTYHVAHPGGRSYEHLPGERLRGRGAPRRALRSRSATRRARLAVAAPAPDPEYPVHARPAPELSARPMSARPTRCGSTTTALAGLRDEMLAARGRAARALARAGRARCSGSAPASCRAAGTGRAA